MAELEFESELILILNRYDASWATEPLDSDEVDRLVEHLKNMLNYMNGNITYKEYMKLEEK